MRGGVGEEDRRREGEEGADCSPQQQEQFPQQAQRQQKLPQGENHQEQGSPSTSPQANVQGLHDSSQEEQLLGVSPQHAEEREGHEGGGATATELAEPVRVRLRGKVQEERQQQQQQQQGEGGQQQQGVQPQGHAHQQHQQGFGHVCNTEEPLIQAAGHTHNSAQPQLQLALLPPTQVCLELI